MNFNGKDLTTPEKVDKHVASFCRRLSQKDPIFVNVEPELWCKQSNCEMNVDKFITEHGGDKVIGYKIWYLRGKFIEAERHVIYCQDGQYKDLTFNTDG